MLNFLLNYCLKKPKYSSPTAYLSAESLIVQITANKKNLSTNEGINPLLYISLSAVSLLASNTVTGTNVKSIYRNHRLSWY